MSDGASPGGFTARLLGRADGQFNALRPQIANTFAAEGGGGAPLLERSEETVVEAPHAAEPGRPAASTSPAEQRQTVETPRLMPAVNEQPEALTVAPVRADAPHPAQPATVTFRQNPEHTMASTAEVVGGIAAVEPLAQVQTRTQVQTQTQAPPVTPRGGSLLAVVSQLLGPQLLEASVPGAPAEPATADPFNPSPAKISEAPAGASPQQPLQIHIGELVIAPEPRAPEPAAMPTPQWQPPLSLDAYRASRSRAQS